MKKILDFLKANPIIVTWTIWYFFILWFILHFIFNFDAFSYKYWWRFFHSTLHGFGGFMFGIIMYAAIPMYIATTLTVYRTKEFVIPVPFAKTFSTIWSKIFTPEPEQQSVSEENTEPEITNSEESEFPPDLPTELRIPFKRAKNRLPLTVGMSVYNQPSTTLKQKAVSEPVPNENPEMPIPMDFDVSDTIEPTMSDSVPTFKDIDFDIPIATQKELKNKTVEYFEKKNIPFETYRDFVATEKFVIYEHSDDDFWVMDGDSWFATGKQKDSPVNELLNLAKQNGLTPVLYLASQNIMDVENTIKTFESMGIRVIKDLSELD